MQALRKAIWITATVLYIILIQTAQSSSRIDALVNTKVGLIGGLQAPDGDYAMFMGIPYAKIEEDNPFGPSVPFPKFEEVFEAYNDSAICPQMNNQHPVGHIDCLYLNVYVPNSASSENRLPILVWIHGGQFISGHFSRNLYGARSLVRHDVILVTLNYRVGPYGFICLDTPKVPGNQGLKDQRLALKWVKDNIKEFGGDNNEITIFGESAGGVSVDLHLYYTKDKLFNKVIMQSGNALCPWAVKKSDQSIPIKLAQHLGFNSDDVDEALSFLSVTNPNLVITASTELNLEYSPCVEKYFENVDIFFGVHPINTDIRSVKDIPILIGHNDLESLRIVNYNSDEVFQQHLDKYFNFDSEELTAMEKNIRNFYIGDEILSPSTVMSIVEFSSDFSFNYPTVRSISSYLENGATSIFYYVFSYVSDQKLEIDIELNISIKRASHGDELPYLFYPMLNNKDSTTEDQVVIDRITILWTNFAKFGNPTPELSELLPVTWIPVSSDSMTYLNVSSELEIKRRPFHDRMAFWDLFYELNKKAQKGYLDD